MPRVTHRDFAKGLWYAGPRDVVPAGFVRKAKGVRAWSLTNSAIRSRWGHQQFSVCPNTIRGIFRFDQNRYVHVDNTGGSTDFGKIVGGAFSSILGAAKPAQGSTLRVATAIPSLDADLSAFLRGPEHLFVAGSAVTSAGVQGGSRTPFKISTTGVVTPWGIPAPPYDKNQPQLALSASVRSAVVSPVIIAFEGTAFVVDPDTEANGVYIGSHVNRQVGSSSQGFTCNQDATFSISVARSLDLLNYTQPDTGNQARSSSEDFIRLWVFCDNPDHLDSLEIVFDVTDTNQTPLPSNIGSDEHLKDTFAFKVLVEDTMSDTSAVTGTSDDTRLEEQRHPLRAKRKKDQAQIDRIRGIDNSGAKSENTPLSETLGLSNAATVQILKDLSTLRLSSKASTWTLLRIPKKLFTPSGKAVHGVSTQTGERTWAHVRRVRLTATTNGGGSVVLLFDEMGLHLGTGMFGKYKYAVTYKDSKTGSRSNPSVIVETPVSVERQIVLLSGFNLLKSSMPANVDRVEVWRTLGNGDALFKIEEFNPLTQPIQGQYEDFIADYEGMQESVPIGIGTRTTKYMTDEPLPFDNEPPNVLTIDVAGPYLGSLWTVSAKKGDRGKLFFSPPGRPESIAGFIFVSSDDDPIQRVIHWNGLYVWTRKRIFAIEGTNPFIAREIHGVPGTNDPNSIISTPHGVAYRSWDGPRLFNGSTAPLVNPEAIYPVFHNELLDGEPVAVGNILASAFFHEEWYLSDSSFTYACNLRTGAWRNCGYAARALLCEEDVGALVGGIGSTLYVLEVPNQKTDQGTAIPFEVEVPGVVTEDQSGVTRLVQRVYFDIDTSGQQLSAILLSTGDHLTAIDIGPIITSARQMVEVSLATPSDIAGILLSGSVSDEIELAGVYYDLHIPEPGGSLT